MWGKSVLVGKVCSCGDQQIEVTCFELCWAKISLELGHQGQHSILGGFCALRAGFEGFPMDMEGQGRGDSETVPLSSARCCFGDVPAPCPRAAELQLRAAIRGGSKPPAFGCCLFGWIFLCLRGEDVASRAAAPVAPRASRDPAAEQG